jgi:hypothetical protein
MKTRTVGVLAAALLICAATTAHADSVVVTGGAFFSAWNIDGGGITLVSDRFNVEAGWDCTSNANFSCGSFPTWSPGQVVDFSTTAVGNRPFGGLISSRSGAGTVDGVDYPWTGGRPGLLFGGTSLAFSVAPFPMPESTPARTNLEVTRPFTMTGVLVLTTPGGVPVFSDFVSGSGQLMFGLTSDGSTYTSSFAFGNFIFRASSASPTPEPATLLLFATGGVVAGARRLRGHQ